MLSIETASRRLWFLAEALFPGRVVFGQQVPGVFPEPAVAVTALVADVRQLGLGDAVTVADIGLTGLKVVETGPEVRGGRIRHHHEVLAAEQGLRGLEPLAFDAMGFEPGDGSAPKPQNP